MACCCNKLPVVVISRKSLIATKVTWNDRGCSGLNTRRLRWRFWVRGRFVYETPIGLPTDILPIGTGSTYAYINATDAEITSFVQTASGISIATGDVIQIRAVAYNCEGESAESNVLSLLAQPTFSECYCTFLTEFQTGITGASAVLPGGFSANLLAWRNGLANYAGNNFSGLESTDELMFADLTGCAATLDKETVSGVTGNVPIPIAFQSVPVSDYLLFRNGLLQYGHTVLGTNIVPTNAPSDLLDDWMFVRVEGSANGCHFRAVLVSASYSGATVSLPGGFNSGNQSDWVLFRNGLSQYPVPASASGYVVSVGGVVTPVIPFSADQIWVIEII